MRNEKRKMGGRVMRAVLVVTLSVFVGTLLFCLSLLHARAVKRDHRPGRGDTSHVVPYALILKRSEITISPGSSAKVPLQISFAKGFHSKIHLYLLDAPAGVTVSLQSSTQKVPVGSDAAAATATLTAKPATFPGCYAIKIMGKSPGWGSPAPEYLSLTVASPKKPLPFRISLDNTEYTAQQGDTFRMMLAVRSKPAFRQWIKLKIINDPAQPVAGSTKGPDKIWFDLSPGAVRGAGDISVTGYVGRNVQTGDQGYNLLVRATASDGSWQEARFTVTVGPYIGSHYIFDRGYYMPPPPFPDRLLPLPPHKPNPPSIAP